MKGLRGAVKGLRSAASIALATLLGGASTLSMCGTGSEINGVKFSPTMMKFDISLGGTGNDGRMHEVPKSGAEIEGLPLVCGERDEKGKRNCEAMK